MLDKIYFQVYVYETWERILVFDGRKICKKCLLCVLQCSGAKVYAQLKGRGVVYCKKKIHWLAWMV
jgi:hypothetical protein